MFIDCSKLVKISACLVFAHTMTGSHSALADEEHLTQPAVEITTDERNALITQTTARITRTSFIVSPGNPDPIDSLPAYICNFGNLQRLEVMQNNITRLPGCLNNHYRTLRDLRIVSNPVDNLGILNNRFPSLEQIVLDNVSLSEGGFTLSHSDEINVIELKNCGMRTTAPFNIHSNPNLTSLTIENCGLDGRLEENPGIFTGLYNLQHLSLANNNLTYIPSGFPFLVSLQNLDLRGNAFSPTQQQQIRLMFAGMRVSINF